MSIITPRGTKDIMPDEVYKWQFLEGKFRIMAETYGFSEIRTPLFEYTELFQRGVGETTDIVQKEMYSFNDQKGRSLTLKPEGTASAVRAFIEHKSYAEVQPTKYYYITPCYRYEAPQSGRQREFHQFGLEIFGAEGMLADAEVIGFAKTFLKDLGIDNVELRINSVGCPNCRARYREVLKDYFRPHLEELCETCKIRFENNPMRIIDCKSPQDKELALGAPSILDYLCEDCSRAFRELKENLDTMGMDYVVDPTIVRGLDYYTKTAFEFVTDQIGAQGTVCGGGRYDNLIEEIGGPSVPGVGFGLGIERLLLLMEAKEVEIPKGSGPRALIVTMGEEAKARGLRILGEMRARGIRAQMDLQERNMKGQLKYADRLGAKYAVIIGENELQEGACQVKNLAESRQERVAFKDLIEYVSGEEE